MSDDPLAPFRRKPRPGQDGQEPEPLTEHQAQEMDRDKAMELLRSKLSVKFSDPPTVHEALGMAVSAIVTHAPYSELTGEIYTERYSNTNKLGAALWQTHLIANERLNGRQIEPEAGYEPITEHQALGLAIGALRQLPDYPITEWYAGGHSNTYELLPVLQTTYEAAALERVTAIAPASEREATREIDIEPEM